MIEKQYDTVIIGGGAAGMAAAVRCDEKGLKVAIVEREDFLGGILMQCIHNGFGLHRFKEELTGPEYAEKFTEQVHDSNAEVFLDTTVVDITNDGEEKIITACSKKYGVILFKSRSVVLAMGCRERNRGNIGIPGARTSGIFTAGLAQRLLNIDGFIPGQKVVIIGSGDIGLIMARRLSWVGCKVLCVVEIMPHPSGLTRNVVQCLHDFDIPLYLSHAVCRINGKDRVESVDIAPLENGASMNDKSFNIECDTLLMSVGLIPENELSLQADIKINPDTNGPFVDAGMMSNVDGVFACGNVLHVHDLVDFVSEESDRCADSVVGFLSSKEDFRGGQIPVSAGAHIKYVVPNKFAKNRDNKFLMRAMITKEAAELQVKSDDEIIIKRKLKNIKPAEMIDLTLTEEEVAKFADREKIEIDLILDT
jgi:thioredoxin reductase